MTGAVVMYERLIDWRISLVETTTTIQGHSSLPCWERLASMAHALITLDHESGEGCKGGQSHDQGVKGGINRAVRRACMIRYERGLGRVFTVINQSNRIEQAPQ